jgi:hypothetical protein
MKCLTGRSGARARRPGAAPGPDRGLVVPGSIGPLAWLRSEPRGAAAKG